MRITFPLHALKTGIEHGQQQKGCTPEVASKVATLHNANASDSTRKSSGALFWDAVRGVEIKFKVSVLRFGVSPFSSSPRVAIEHGQTSWKELEGRHKLRGKATLVFGA